MVERSHHDTGKEDTHASQSRGDCGVDFGSGADWKYGGGLSSGRDQSGAILPLEGAVQERGHRGDQDIDSSGGKKHCGSRGERGSEGKLKTEGGAHRELDRAAVAEKKRELGLYGDLRGRHLPRDLRQKLLFWIEFWRDEGHTLQKICKILELNPRAITRWRSGETYQPHHGGGGGHNRVLTEEKERVVAHAKTNPQASCRRVAYDLEREGQSFIGKTKVAEIMKEHGLNRPKLAFGQKKEVLPPGEMLLHEPWKPNLLWGMDWTWVRVENYFMFLLIVVDWYSRKILAWGLYRQITQFEVVATITDAVAKEKIDRLPAGSLRPRIVADHGSANTAKFTRENIEVQGLDLWLSGIGRPTGNARTERAIGTLKEEEIKLQDHYSSEKEARHRIHHKIWDCNHRRPNSGNGGFAPAFIHQWGRKIPMDQRKKDRQETENKRREFWKQTMMSAKNITSQTT